MNFDQLLRFAVELDASDVHCQTGAPPQLRIGGVMRELDAPALTAEQLRGFATSVGPRAIAENLDSALARGADFAHEIAGLARFRCNLYSHLGTPGLVLRVILPHIRSVEELHLPAVTQEIALARRGLTLLSGATGSGKSTTLAAMIDLLNNTHHLKILTIEDPVEYVHASKKSLISHVEVGRDTPSFEHGLRQAVRQAPDVILVGELRDADTVRMALRAADTGHQVFSTVHSANATQTIERLLAMVPQTEQPLARQQLAGALVGVIAQRLILNKSGQRWPVVEVLRADAVTRRFILEDRLAEMADYVATGQRGMQTFDRHIVALYHEGIISGTQALTAATNPEAVDFELRKPKTGA
jgi:twitching motility protein PilT